MPQRSQHPLVYILLIWTSILSIILISFITVFFTRGQSSNSSTVGHTSQLHSTSYSTEIVNFRAQDFGLAQSTIEWNVLTKSILTTNDPRKPLQLLKEGNYILNLRVTLSKCDQKPISDKLHSVALRLNGMTRLIGWVDAQSKSTGLLTKIIFLTVATKVEITVDPSACIATNITETHLDIIWLDKRQF